MATSAHETGGTVPVWTCGDRLRKAREAAGLSQQELADAVGISRGSVTNYEGDKHPPRKIVVNGWALATGTDVDWLRDGITPGGPSTGQDAHIVGLLVAA